MKPTLLFDADGVVINAKMFSQHLELDYGITQEQTKDFFTGVFIDCLEGKADLKDEIKPYLEQWGWIDGVDVFLSYWFEAEHVVDERLIELVQQLRSKGHECYVATDNEHYRTNYMRNEMGFNKWFDGVFSSAELGAKKPKERFFTKILEKINLEAGNVWFFDDTLSKVKGAAAVGINAVHYTGLDEFQKLIEGEEWLTK